MKIQVLFCLLLAIYACRNSNKTGLNFYKKGPIREFDFSRMPLKGDIDSLASNLLISSEVKDQSLNNMIKGQRNYLKLFYYSDLDPQNHKLFTVLGYYDLYYDLWLVTVNGDSVANTTLIASISGDDSITEEIKTTMIENSNFEFRKIYMMEKRLFSTPDTLKLLTGYKSRLTVGAKGNIAEEVIYQLAKDSVIRE